MRSIVENVDILDEIKKNFQSPELLLVIDESIVTNFPDVLSSFKVSDQKRIWICRGGDKAKTLEQYGQCLEQFLSLGIHRKDQLLVIGGGAASDFGGFIAATLLRSIRWSVIPTTLLSMIDASIGGKTALNSKAGKNLIGAFHLPERVLIDTRFLKTLPGPEYQSGLGELLKYAYLSASIHKLITQSSALNEIIFACADYKQAIVEKDLKESGDRKFLNFGHTLGHAVEKLYQIAHGEAVFWGIYLIIELYKDSAKEQFCELASKLSINFQIPPWHDSGIDIEAICQYLDKDKKKVSANEVELVLIQEIGKPYCEKHLLSEIKSKLQEKKNVIDQFTL